MLIGLQNVTFEFGARLIVRDATWHIQPGERIGLIGYNGTGKSTLLKVLVGQYSPSKGTVEKGKETTIGYLHQDLLSFDSNDSILDVAMGAFERVKQLEKEIEAIGKKLEESENEELLISYTDKLHELDVLDGYNIQYKTEEVLLGLGFTVEQLQKPYKQFSGGWRMRVLLAKMILQAPDVLLLDEPTNHLDLPSIEWLERYLLQYKGSVVIVSHDKFFLNKMVNKIVELYQQELHIYSGDYDYYLEEKVLRVELQQRAYENQQDYIRQQERFIERFKAKASKAAAAQSVMKRLDKIDKIESVEIERPDMRINFQVNNQPGRVLVTLKNIHKKYDQNVIIKDGNAEIDRGDKIALIGANGKGKSTLLRLIAGTENNYEGNRLWGHNVESSFYAQHQLEALNLENTILQEMVESRSGKNEMELRTLLGCFLFSGDDTDKKIKLLSGGEKARVALAKVIVSKSNFLMLDEPTNHLDMHSVELLAEALNKYEGSLILVSHDRYFVSKTANKIWEIVNGEIKEFKGTYDEFVEWKERQAKALKEKSKGTDLPPAKNIEKPSATPKPSASSNTDKKTDANELKKMQNRFNKLEQELSQMNKEKESIEAQLAHPDTYKNPNAFAETEKKYLIIKQNLAKAEKEYEELFEKLT